MYIFERIDDYFIAYLDKQVAISLINKNLGVKLILDYTKPDCSHTFNNGFEVGEVLEVNKKFLVKIKLKNGLISNWFKTHIRHFKTIIINSFEDDLIHFDYTTNKAFYDYTVTVASLNIDRTDIDWCVFLATVFNQCEHILKLFVYNKIVENGEKVFEDVRCEVYKFKNCLIEKNNELGCVNFKVNKYE